VLTVPTAPAVIPVQVVTDTGGVPQKMLERGPRVAGVDAVAQLGEGGDDGGVPPDRALFHQHGGDRGRDRLGARGDVEGVVDRRPVGRTREAFARHPEADDPAAVDDADAQRRQAVPGAVGFREGVDVAGARVALDPERTRRMRFLPVTRAHHEQQRGRQGETPHAASARDCPS
jgi:hypothetical protein